MVRIWKYLHFGKFVCWIIILNSLRTLINWSFPYFWILWAQQVLFPVCYFFLVKLKKLRIQYVKSFNLVRILGLHQVTQEMVVGPNHYFSRIVWFSFGVNRRICSCSFHLYSFLIKGWDTLERKIIWQKLKYLWKVCERSDPH